MTYSSPPPSHSFTVEPVRELTLKEPIEPGRPSFITSASGLVERNGKFFCIADDESSIFSWGPTDKNLTVHKLSALTLGVDPAQRKAKKPDFESLVILSEKQWAPHGALLAWPSASTLQRMSAYIIPFDAKDQLGEAKKIDILPLAYTLAGPARDLNIEGIMVHADTVFLFQRGNGKGARSGFFEIKSADFITGLKSGAWPQKIKFEKVKSGKLNQVKLTLADGVWSQYGLLAFATAEDTQSSYADGKVHGTVLMRLVKNKAEIIGKLTPNYKFEGALARPHAQGIELFLVDDADDPKKASRLFRVIIDKKYLETLTLP